MERVYSVLVVVEGGPVTLEVVSRAVDGGLPVLVSMRGFEKRLECIWPCLHFFSPIPLFFYYHLSLFFMFISLTPSSFPSPVLFLFFFIIWQVVENSGRAADIISYAWRMLHCERLEDLGLVD